MTGAPPATGFEHASDTPSGWTDPPPITSFKSVNILLRGADGRTLLQMRDGAGAGALTWGFWGGGVEASDVSLADCAVRELGEELRLEALPQDFAFLSFRGRRAGHLAALLLYRRSVAWTEIDVREGAGAGFFWRSELLRIDVSQAVREHLMARPDLFADWASRQPRPAPGE